MVDVITSRSADWLTAAAAAAAAIAAADSATDWLTEMSMSSDRHRGYRHTLPTISVDKYNIPIRYEVYS